MAHRKTPGQRKRGEKAVRPARAGAGKQSGTTGGRRPGKAKPAHGRGDRESGGPPRLWIYGRHAALAALGNPGRPVNQVLASKNALGWLAEARLPESRLMRLQEASPQEIGEALQDGAVHQGLAVEVGELPRAPLKEACAPDGSRRPVLILDQITDPHNIGAIFRSAAAFGVRAVVVQDRRTPPLAGALAKAAAGAVESVPCVEVVNISRAIEGLQSLGYYCAGLAGESGAAIRDAPRDCPLALVLGAEGAGLRRLVGESCDGLYSIPIARGMESLNVSNAAAVALYEVTRAMEFLR